VADNSSIEWTDATWNPVRGCAIVSKGCTNCYAMRQAHRSSGAGGAYEGLTKLSKGGPVWTGKVRLVPELLEQPLQWRRPRLIFVNSMSDLFHEDVPVEFIYSLWCVMAAARRHRFQILTKRAARMREVLTAAPFTCQVLDNVWLGVSVEDQVAADERIPQLLATPAAVRWISAEPLLGLVDLIGKDEQGSALHEYEGRPRLDGIVAGGESGPGARPMHPQWARYLRDQCRGAGVPFFFKQWGNWAPCPFDSGGHVASDQEKLLDGTWLLKVGKKSAGRELDGRTHDEYPA
jgi:protein gp37